MIESTMTVIKAVSMETEDGSGGEVPLLVTARATAGMALFSFENLSASGPKKIGLQWAREIPLNSAAPGRKCCFVTR